MKYSKYFIVPLLFLSCKGSIQDDGGVVIDITSIAESNITMSFDDFLEIQECIPLQTTKSCMLSSNASVLTVTSKDILIRDRDNIYRFNRNGDFKNIIGVFGHGHSEHGKILSACSDNEMQMVYILTLDRKIYMYSFDGIFVGLYSVETSRNESIKSIYHIGKSFFCEMRTDNSDGVKSSICIYNQKGVKDKEFVLYKDEKSFPVNRESFSIGYQYLNNLRFILEYDNKLFSIADTLCVNYTLSDEKVLPNRAFVEDVRNRPKLMRDMLQVLDIKETTNYLFFIVYFRNKYKGIVYNKSSRKPIYSSEDINPKLCNGINLDQQEHFGVWPIWSDGKILTSIIPSELMKKNNKLCSMFHLNNITEKDNPILCIYTEK